MTVLSDPARSQAVLIGVHSYAHLDDLPAVAGNLEGLRQVLTDPAVWGLPGRACTVIAQPDKTGQVLDLVQEKAAAADDTLLIYYAGHGQTDPYSDELYLGMPSSRRERTHHSLRYEDLRRIVLEAPSPRTVVILDCCYSGRALVGGMSAGERIADSATVRGSYLLTATSETRVALAPPGEPHTAFTGELIRTLSEGIPGGPELIEMSTLFGRLRVSLEGRSLPVPQQRNRDTAGHIAIARNRWGTTTREGAPGASDRGSATRGGGPSGPSPDWGSAYGAGRPRPGAGVRAMPSLGWPEPVWTVAFSPDGRVLANASVAVSLVDATTRKLVVPPLVGHTDIVWGLEFSPDGRRLATASHDRTVGLWNTGTGKLAFPFLTGHRNLVWDVAFTPDGRRLATAGHDGTVWLWDTHTGQPARAPLRGHDGPVYSVAFSPDGRHLASSGQDGMVTLWSAETWTPVARLTGHTDRVNEAAFSPDGTFVVSGSADGTARLWNGTSGHSVPLGGHLDTVEGVAFSPDSRYVVTTSHDGTVRVWDSRTGVPVGAPLTGHTDAVFRAAFSPDGSLLATAGRDGTTRLWDFS